MNEILGEAIEIAVSKFVEDMKSLGESELLEDGNKFVTCFENGTIIISRDNGEMKIAVIAGKAYSSEYKLPIFN